MAYYLQLMALTDKGRQNFEENPEWIREISKTIELMGVKILTQYALLGQYDFVNIIEAPSDEVAAKLSLKLSAMGAFQPTTFAAIPLNTLIESIKSEKKQKPW
ncbi:MAG: GYD domain-containing protein [Dehalococcoidales bacterium]|nr:GYD domain-containing protein [Dehalococcoidales bacterium]